MNEVVTEEQETTDRFETEVITQDRDSSTFRLAGSIRADIDRLIQNATVIRLLVLMEDGQPVAEIRNVRLTGSHGNSIARIEGQPPPTDMQPIEFTDIDYEELDG
jgi:hypothetical protein